MHKRKLLIGCISFTLLAGCASSISNRQKIELDTYESRGLAVQEKSPGTAAVLGILPGFGSFYGREYALGVVNLLFWPLSICWDPVSGYNAATRINYVETKQHVADLKNKALNELNTKRANGLIDSNLYNMELYNISQKYDMDPIAMPVITSPTKGVGNSDRDQRIQALQQQNLPYNEYQQRYNEIMAE